jgi:uncharacterized RDD family membrane protein YckC
MEQAHVTARRNWPVLGRRALARLLDFGLSVVVSLVAATLLWPAFRPQDPADVPEVRGVLFLLGLPLLYTLQEVVLVALGGRTLGKAVAGLRVRRLDGGPPGWGRAVLRVGPVPLLFATIFGPLLYLLPYLWAVVAADGRGLHDLLAGTTVEDARG